MDWIKKVASYAPDIALALATGGTSALGSLALRTLGEYMGYNSTTSKQEIITSIEQASTTELIELSQVNNQFLIDKLRLEKEDQQKAHTTTQETIRQGDSSQYWFVRFTRPMQSWVCLAAAIYLASQDTGIEYVGVFLGITGAYMGMRELGKWKVVDSLKGLKK